LGNPAAKQGDKVVGVDNHIVMVPSPGGPVPTPMPLPFNGVIDGNLSKDVFIEGKPAATVDSTATNTPPHLVPPPSSFQKPPSNKGKIIIGSTGVFINGKPAARTGDKAQTCNDPADLPSGSVVALGAVLIGETGSGAPLVPVPVSAEKKLIKAKVGEPGVMVSAKWENEKARAGDEVNLTATTKEYSEGAPAHIMIWRSKGGVDTVIEQKETEVIGNRVVVPWKFKLEEEADLKNEVADEEEPSFRFAIEVEGEERSASDLKFTYPLDIYLEDESGTLLDDVEFKITFADGTEKKGRFKEGHAKVDDAPYGKFKLDIEGYDIG
jgi:uncharacterized Zn-binding protein involved in type VI secretion